MGNSFGNKHSYKVAHNLLLFNNFEKLAKTAGGICHIVPLKGIDLLYSLYNNRLDREVRDIDILVFPEEQAGVFLDRLLELGYRAEYKFGLQPDVLGAKGKVSLLSPSLLMANVDVHLRFVTKKFFSMTIGDFNKDVLLRCRPSRSMPSVREMDSIDRWLFLAQHYAFHFYNGKKWLLDLFLLQKEFSPQQVSELYKRCFQYGFCRILNGACFCIEKKYGLENVHVRSIETEGGKGFLLFLQRFWKSHGRLHRFICTFWEFAFIDLPEQRKLCYRRLVFPKLGLMKNIYRTKSDMCVILLYPFHAFFSCLSLLAFRCIYNSWSREGGHRQ